jgi:hypothetical protein
VTLSIRTRLLAGFVAVVVVVSIATFGLLDRTLGQSLRSDLDARLRDQARGVVRWIEGSGAPDRLAPRLAIVVGARVTIIGGDGLVEGDSERREDLGRPIGLAPEVLRARQGRPGRAFHVLERGGPSFYTVAMPAAGGRAVRLAVPSDRITGLEVGADDYVVKPFIVREVILRVTALASRIAERKQRQALPPATSTIKLGPLTIDPVACEVSGDAGKLSLRPLEYKLLVTLASAPGRVFSREDLLAEVWDIHGAVSTRTVDVHVRRLRAKLGTEHEHHIGTVRNVGYRARRLDPGAA